MPEAKDEFYREVESIDTDTYIDLTHGGRLIIDGSLDLHELTVVANAYNKYIQAQA